MEGAKSGGQCLWECNGKWEQTVVECLSRGGWRGGRVPRKVGYVVKHVW